MHSKFTGTDSQKEASSDDLDEIDQLHRRQTLRITLAIFLIWIAVTSTSQAAQFCLRTNEPGAPIQLDGFTPGPIADQMNVDQSVLGPAYVQLFAELSNFDRDADPDGWHASVVVRSDDGSVLDVPGRATFEILEQSQRYHSHRYQGDTTRTRISKASSLVRFRPLARWSVPLQFDEQGVAAVKLPASLVVKRKLGWDSVAVIHTGTRIAASHEWHRWNRVRDDPGHRNFITQNVRDRIDFPWVGWLRVRLAIPGQRPLEAVAPIDIRPALLVDMPGRYR